MRLLKQPWFQWTIGIGLFTAILVGALGTLTLPTFASKLFLVLVWIAGIAAAAIDERMAPQDKSFRQRARYLAVFFLTTSLIAVLFRLTASALGIEGDSTLARAMLGGLTFGSGVSIGLATATFVSPGRRVTRGQSQGN